MAIGIVERTPATVEWNPHAWAEARVDAETIKRLEADGGYGKISADEKSRLAWQDVLDAAFHNRVVDARNALRDLGWEGRHLREGDPWPMTKKIGGAVVALCADFDQVGAGRNIVGISWMAEMVRAPGCNGWWPPLEDSMSELAAGLAQRIDEEAIAFVARLQGKLIHASPSGIDTTELRKAIHGSRQPSRYEAGFVDAIESMVLALRDCETPMDQIEQAVQTAVEAFGNNADLVDDEDDVDENPAPLLSMR